MGLFEGNIDGPAFVPSGAGIPTTPQEDFVKRVYAAVDEAAAGSLDRLRVEEGIVPPCREGCSHCCWFHIQASPVEAHALGQFIKREFSAQQLESLRKRTQQWHEWESSRPGRRRTTEVDEQVDLSDYQHCCPLLVDGACSAYPARPIMCRTHYVAAEPLRCKGVFDPLSSLEAPVVLTAVLDAARPFAAAIREHTEAAGLDYSRSILLLPQWLAIEMGWEFAVAR